MNDLDYYKQKAILYNRVNGDFLIVVYFTFILRAYDVLILPVFPHDYIAFFSLHENPTNCSFHLLLITEIHHL